MNQKQAALEIIKRLREKGFTALLAGGCVRDMLLGRKAKDYDVATNALPQDVKRIFQRTLEIGAQFGVVVVLMPAAQVEVATFRTEYGYADGRHPSVVEFAHEKEDASRRDFTINGMFYDPIEQKVIDFVDGRQDLEKKIIRTIGLPEQRFGEDYLRMLRAIRFSTELGFDIEKDTFDAICAKSSNITKISAERIAIELEKTLTHPNRSCGAAKLVQSKLAQAIFPLLKNQWALQGIQTLGKLRTNVNFALALSAFWCAADFATAIDQVQTLKLSRDSLRHITCLLQNRDVLLDDQMPISKLKRLASNPYFRDLFDLQKAMLRASGQSILPLKKIKLRLRQLRGIELAPRPLLNGHDLIALGATPGPQVGQLAEEMYVLQLEGQLKTPDQARQWAQNWLRRQS